MIDQHFVQDKNKDSSIIRSCSMMLKNVKASKQILIDKSIADI